MPEYRYHTDKNGKVHKIKTENLKEPPIRKCVICEKPVNSGGWYCTKCKQKVKLVSDFLVNKYHLRYDISRSVIARINQMYPDAEDIFDFILQNPHIIFDYFSLSASEKNQLRESYKWKKNRIDELDLTHVPKYILNYFSDNEDKILVDIHGNEKEPTVKYKCCRCGKEFSTVFYSTGRFSGHKCDAALSKGEYLVKKYLEEKGVKFLTQFDTIRCENPKTNFVLPYDFEIRDKKVIIEVQGEQHNQYISYFHSSKDAFEYQKYKDEVKKSFALSHGYKFVEIFYKDINNNNYKKILDEVI